MVEERPIASSRMAGRPGPSPPATGMIRAGVAGPAAATLTPKEDNETRADASGLTINTGMRLSEMWSLEWSQVDIEKRELYLPPEKVKSKRGRYVRLNGAAMEAIERLYIEKKNGLYVLYHPGTSSQITRQINRLSKRFLGKVHTPHAWRVTFATRALQGRKIRGEDGRVYRVRADLKTIATVAGWEPDSKVLLRIYAKTTEEAEREAVSFVEIGPDSSYRVPEKADVPYTDTARRKRLPVN